VEKVLINLIKKAAEATSSIASPQIKCTCHSEIKKGENIVVISVEDNGHGILPEVMERIFVPFFTTKNNGSGIGLSLCKQIMMNHGGEIHVESKIEKGTKVTLTLNDAHALR
jgi:C4-dicarboxylate-specific signal transduction histidine kinase